MHKDYSKMTIEELEKEIEHILSRQVNQDDLFRAVVLMGQLDVAKFIYHDKKHQPNTRYVKSNPKAGELAGFGQALVQLLLLAKSRGIDFTKVFEHAIEHMKDNEYAARIPKNHGEISGHPINSGKVSGRAYVLQGNSLPEDIPKDSIIVVEHAEPELAEVIKDMKAVVTDQGGRMCHMAIVARESGMPAIVGTGNATSLIKTGDEILVDAGNGKVTISNK